MDDANYIGNISTIVKYVSMLIAGLTIGALVSVGVDLNIDQSVLSELIGAIIFFILAHIDATHPNTFKFLGNQQTPTQDIQSEPVLNNEYESDNDDAA